MVLSGADRLASSSLCVSLSVYLYLSLSLPGFWAGAGKNSRTLSLQANLNRWGQDLHAGPPSRRQGGTSVRGWLQSGAGSEGPRCLVSGRAGLAMEHPTEDRRA